MNFNEALKKQREAAKLTQKVAAERLHLSLKAYQDREDDRVSMNVPERCGLLVGLGLAFEDALKIATQANTYKPFSPEAMESMKQRTEDPFVRETEDAFIFVSRQHDDFEAPIPKAGIKTAENILGWVDHMGSKGWVTREHLRMFVGLASQYLKLTIHPIG